MCACVFIGPTSVLAAAAAAAAGFLVALTLVVRLGALSPTSSSECSVLVSDWSELCWDDVSSARDMAARERAAGLDKNWESLNKRVALLRLKAG